MSYRLPRRKRLIAITTIIAGIFIASTGLIVWASGLGGDTYRPGERMAGLTDELARDLPPDYPRITFTDVTAESGIDFVHFSGTRTSQLPEDMGSGAAWADFDGDGWMDIAVANISAPLASPLEEAPPLVSLYRNRGDGTFEDVTTRAGIGLQGTGMGVSWADYDADDHPDLFLSTFGTNVLLRNRGDGMFEDVSAPSRIGEHAGFWSGGAWADFDRDGDLDLYVTGYVHYVALPEGSASLQYDAEVPASINPSSFDPHHNLLFRNRGDGTFEEEAERLGIDNPQGRSLSATWADFDEDGWLDLYVANDVSDNVLYRNLGSDRFEEISHAALVADYRGAMGIAVGDWDGDLDQDLFVTHWIAQENALYSNMLTQAREIGVSGTTAYQFSDVADRFGLGQSSLDFIGWGTSFLDFDNDGRLDLFIANGSTFQSQEDPTRLIPMRDQLFWNRSNEEGYFDVSSAAGRYFMEAHVGRGVAVADYDNDGDQDVFVVNHGGPPALLRNDGGNAAAWTQIDLRGLTAGESVTGAWIRVVADGRVQLRQTGVQASYCSQNSTIEHFGLGSAVTVDSVIVSWPDGSEIALTELPVRSRILVRRGASALAEAAR